MNLKFEHKNSEYLFVHLVFGDNKIDNALKRVFKLKDRSNDLYLVLCKIIDQFDLDPKKNEKSEFVYVMLPERDKDLKCKKEKYSSIHIFTDDKYYDRTYPGKMIYNKIRKKLPVIYFNFDVLNPTKVLRHNYFIYIVIFYLFFNSINVLACF